MDSQPQNPEFRINPENFHPCRYPEWRVNPCPAEYTKMSPTNMIPRQFSCTSSLLWWICMQPTWEHGCKLIFPKSNFKFKWPIVFDKMWTNPKSYHNLTKLNSVFWCLLTANTFYGERRCKGIPGPEGIIPFSYSSQLSTKFILLINVKMPTIVGILTFISMINTTPERLKARNFFTYR